MHFQVECDEDAAESEQEEVDQRDKKYADDLDVVGTWLEATKPLFYTCSCCAPVAAVLS
jgi:hypothetical protein